MSGLNRVRNFKLALKNIPQSHQGGVKTYDKNDKAISAELELDKSNSKKFLKKSLQK